MDLFLRQRLEGEHGEINETSLKKEGTQPVGMKVMRQRIPDNLLRFLQFLCAELHGLTLRWHYAGKDFRNVRKMKTGTVAKRMFAGPVINKTGRNNPKICLWIKHRFPALKLWPALTLKTKVELPIVPHGQWIGMSQKITLTEGEITQHNGLLCKCYDCSCQDCL